MSLEEEQIKPSESGRYARPSEIGEEIEQAEEHERVLDAMGDLPDKYRLVITLRYVKHLSYREIAEHLDVPVGTVMSRLNRARAALTEELRRDQSQSEDEPIVFKFQQYKQA